MGTKKIKKFKAGDNVFLNYSGMMTLKSLRRKYGKDREDEIQYGKSLPGVIADITIDENRGPLYKIQWSKRVKSKNKTLTSYWSERFLKFDKQKSRKGIVESGLSILVLINA